jgi:hypothetical protein
MLVAHFQQNSSSLLEVDDFLNGVVAVIEDEVDDLRLLGRPRYGGLRSILPGLLLGLPLEGDRLSCDLLQVLLRELLVPHRQAASSLSRASGASTRHGSR